MNKISAEEMLRAVRVLSNHCHVRHYFDAWHPNPRKILAIQTANWQDVVVDERGNTESYLMPFRCDALVKKGWQWNEENQMHHAERDLEADGLEEERS